MSRIGKQPVVDRWRKVGVAKSDITVEVPRQAGLEFIAPR